MKILVAGIDSDIGQHIALAHSADQVVTTSRNGKGDHKFELSHPFTWPKFEPQMFDKLYYTIGIPDTRASRMEVMQVNCFAAHDFLNQAVHALKPGGQIVVLTSAWGSVSRVDGAQSPWYRMSKAALNMAVAVLAQRHKQVRWTLMQPGWVRTKMNRAEGSSAITAEQSGQQIVQAAAQVQEHFTFIDYTGQKLEF